MPLKELKADLSMKMLELEKAIDLGMPYTDIKAIYLSIKDLQYKIILADLDRKMSSTKDLDLVIE